MTEMTIVKTMFLKAPPEHVWKFLTEKEKLATWFHAGEDDVREGGDFVLVTNTLGKEGERMCWGKVVEFDPPRKLVHTFTHNMLQGLETICTWTLTKIDGGTLLKLEHEGFEKVAENAFSMATNHEKGWEQHLSRLRLVTG